MKELAEHILDIAQNSVAAGAAHMAVTLTEDGRGTLTVVIEDDGKGMSPELLSVVTDPFTTTRTTRDVGMGLPLYRMAAELTGGALDVRSTPGKGTVVTALFRTDHLDCPPLGELPQVIALLIQGSPDMELAFRHITPTGRAELFTRDLRNALGEDISLAEPEIFLWITDYLTEQEAQLTQNKGADLV